MKKIIVTFDGNQYSEGAMKFARQMNYAEKISLTGLFLPQMVFANLWSYADSLSGSAFVPLVEADDAEQINTNIARFHEECNRYGIRHNIQRDFFDFAVPEIRKQTRFADLVIIGSESFYKHAGIDHPNEYLKDTLHSSECPVIIVPESFDYPKSNILAYDGSESSVFAIKQFMYLFPEFQDFPTLLVSVNISGSEYAQNTHDIHELVSDHFSSLSFLNLEFDDMKLFTTWISEKNASILVCGAFSRSTLSQLFRQSFVEEVISEHKIPVFISHR